MSVSSSREEYHPHPITVPETFVSFLKILLEQNEEALPGGTSLATTRNKKMIDSD